MRRARHKIAPSVGLALVLAACAATPAPIDEPKTAAEPSPVDPSSSTSSTAVAGVDGGISTARSASPSPVPSRSEDVTPVGADLPAPAPPELQVIDEPIYFPGARARPKGSPVDASHDDEIVATWNRGGLGTDADNGPKGKPPHAAPRVKVDVIDVRGDASEADLQRVARLKSYWPFRICYEQGLRRTQKLHGTIKLRLTIGPNGHPSGVQQLATQLGDTAVVSCVVKSAMGLGLPAPSSGAPQVTLDISLWPGDEPVSVKTALHGKNAAPAEGPAMTDALRAHLGGVRTCYAEGLRRHEKLWGRLALALRVTSGAVTEVTEIESRFPDPDVTACVQKSLLHAAVPSADGELTIVYPLRLGRAPDGPTAQH